MTKKQVLKLYVSKRYSSDNIKPNVRDAKEKKRLTVATGESRQGHRGEKWKGRRGKRGDDVCLWLLFHPKSIVSVESGSGMDAWRHGSSRVAQLSLLVFLTLGRSLC